MKPGIWIAIDANGDVYRYTKTPFLNLVEHAGIWFSAGEIDYIGCVKMDGIDWRKTRKKVA